MKKLISMLLTLSLVFGLSASAFAAEGKMTVEEAEKYLLDFVKEEVNEDGKIITTTYEFESDKDLQEVATFIAENGAKAFQQKIDENISLKDVDDSDNGQFRRLPSSPIISKTVKGDGTHTVKCEMSGLVKFNKVGNVEYLAKLSCKVDVKKGNVIAINSTSFDMPYVSTGGSYGNIKLDTTVNGGPMGALNARYTITKKINFPIGQGEITVRKESEEDGFALYVLAS